MATLHAGQTPINTSGDLPAVGDKLPAFTLTGADWSEVTMPQGKTVIVSAFPSVDTGTCAASVRKFNELAADLADTVVINVSADLPFALSRFCGAEGIDKVVTASSFKASFGADYGLTMLDGPLPGILARAVFVADPEGNVLHSQLAPMLGEELDYDAVLAALPTS